MRFALAWDDPAFTVKSDPALRRRYRALQSWYREHELHAAYGTGQRGVPIGSLLAAGAVAVKPDLNFLGPEVGPYVTGRIPEVRTEHGALNENRLRHNMLSSQPLCFNLFGGLRGREALAGLLAEALKLDIAAVKSVECERTPQPKIQFLNDQTAFDALVVYRASKGEHRFIAVETKYTEPFSPKVYPHTRYETVADESGWFKKGSAEELAKKRTNQLWRNALLAAKFQSIDGFDDATVVVLALEEDAGAWGAVEMLRSQMASAPEHVRGCSYEALIRTAKDEASLREWAEAFEHRYLDCTPLG